MKTMKIIGIVIAILSAMAAVATCSILIYRGMENTAPAFAITPAFSSPAQLEAAQSAACTHASDATLIGANTLEPAQETDGCTWVYLFASHQKATVFGIYDAGDGTLQEIPVSRTGYTQETLSSVADVGNVAFDADEACKKAASVLSNGKEYATCDASLLLPGIATASTSDPIWEFSFYTVSGTEDNADPAATIACDARTGTVTKIG